MEEERENHASYRLTMKKREPDCKKSPSTNIYINILKKPKDVSRSTLRHYFPMSFGFPRKKVENRDFFAQMVFELFNL